MYSETVWENIEEVVDDLYAFGFEQPYLDGCGGDWWLDMQYAFDFGVVTLTFTFDGTAAGLCGAILNMIYKLNFSGITADLVKAVMTAQDKMLKERE